LAIRHALPKFSPQHLSGYADAGHDGTRTASETDKFRCKANE